MTHLYVGGDRQQSHAEWQRSDRGVLPKTGSQLVKRGILHACVCVIKTTATLVEACSGLLSVQIVLSCVQGEETGLFRAPERIWAFPGTGALPRAARFPGPAARRSPLARPCPTVTRWNAMIGSSCPVYACLEQILLS